MKKKYWILIILLLLLAALADIREIKTNDMAIEKGQAGEKERIYHYDISLEGSKKQYPFELEVPAKEYTKEQVWELFDQAKEEMEETIFQDEKSQYVFMDLNLEKTYMNKKVVAEWKTEPYGLISRDGHIDWNLYSRLAKEDDNKGGISTKLTAELSMKGRKEKEICQWEFVVCPNEKGDYEQIEALINEEIRGQVESDHIDLPESIGDLRIKWRRKHSHYFLKLSLLVFVILLLCKLKAFEEKYRRKQERERELLLDYPDIIGKFSVFIGTGMTIQQAFRKLIELYKKTGKERLAYQEIELMLHQISEGEAERKAYQQLADRIALPDYRRFIRIILQQQAKGGSAFMEDLNYEMEQAYRERRNYVKRMAEEAGTKLLLPMMLMLGIVLAIVVTPALMSMNLS